MEPLPSNGSWHLSPLLMPVTPPDSELSMSSSSGGGECAIAIETRVRDVMAQQARAIIMVSERLNPHAVDAFVSMLLRVSDTRGARVCLCGVGKSGIIGRKFAATLSSIGVPAFSMNVTDALHGDLGMLSPHCDVVVMLSNSGETTELLTLCPHIRRIGIASMVAITSTSTSTLARLSDCALAYGTVEENEGKIPSCSTTAVLSLCDALAVTVARMRVSYTEDFRLRHPGGTIGIDIA